MSPVFLTCVAAEQSAASWFDIAVGVAVPTVAAVLTIGAAIWTYIRQQRSRTQDRLRDLFSDALRAVADYQELPYLVRRRSDDSPMKTAEIVRHASDVQTRLDYYVARLRLESDEIGEAYEQLVHVTRQESGVQMSEAWHEPRLSSDSEIPLGAPYQRDSAEAKKANCIKVMQNYVGRPASRPH